MIDATRILGHGLFMGGGQGGSQGAKTRAEGTKPVQIRRKKKPPNQV